MAKEKDRTAKTLTVLLSGRGPVVRKYAGKHVMVVENKIVPLKKGNAGWRDFEVLERKYGRPPVVTFVPQPDIAYILIIC